MEQLEYDARMHELNMRADMECAPMRAEMDSILRRRQVITAQLDELKKQRHELGNRYFDLCSEVRGIREKYNEQKHALYLERLINNTNNHEV